MGLSLRYVVLGMVVERPGHRYDLTCRIAERLPTLGYSERAVYPTIERLVGKGLVAPLRTTVAGGGPDQTLIVYGPTKTGRDLFETWMYRPTPPEATRDALFAKLPLMRHSDLPRLIEMVHDQERVLRADLRNVRRASARPGWNGSGPMPLQLVGARLLQSHDARHIAMTIESLEEIHEALVQELTGQPPSSARRNAARS